MKKLYRSTSDKMIGGVLGGFADYISADITVVRLVYVLITLLAPLPLVVFYIIAWIVVPKTKEPITQKPSDQEKEPENKDPKDESSSVEN